MMLELQNPIEVECENFGSGIGIVIIDYGMHLNSTWIVILYDGRIKHFTSEQIRVSPNYTFGINTTIAEA